MGGGGGNVGTMVTVVVNMPNWSSSDAWQPVANQVFDSGGVWYMREKMNQVSHRGGGIVTCMLVLMLRLQFLFAAEPIIVLAFISQPLNPNHLC